jgi:protein-S-isoprenylcysteine O-methyltransferase Ste14
MTDATQAATGMTARQFVVIIIRLTLFWILFGAVLFVAAGRWDIPQFWAYMVLLFGATFVNSILVWTRDPTLIQERMKPGPGGKDPILRFAGMVGFALHWLVAGLDAGRYRWAAEIPVPLVLLGLAGLATALGISMWAMSVNRFFSSEARIQRDRGHHVVTAGPYQWVRHPGYFAALLMIVSSPLALGSWWSGAPLVFVVPLFFRRLFLEEKLLLAELEGYAEYAARVPFRLVPGVW